MLGSLEAKVLGVLEEEKEASVRDVVNHLNERGEDRAYTTVGTILDRLYEKGLVERTEEPYKGGSRYVYQYIDFQDEYINDVLRDIVSLFGDDGIDDLKDRIEHVENEGIDEVNPENDATTEPEP